MVMKSLSAALTPETADIVPPTVRSRIMKAVGQKNTRPEIALKSILKDLGISYRLHNRNLPGSPDFSNRSHGWVIFVNGCFWHGHKNCSKTKGGRGPRLPFNNREFWAAKFLDNRQRDARKCLELRRLGLKVLLIWECQLREPLLVAERITKTLLKPQMHG
jgi:DNA mismatch endonuclease, patch repair protein